jgi:hypothetical protein
VLRKIMTDFHQNIFYYYRGASQPHQKQYDQQLEDNTTKALVNTLQHSSPTVARKFLRWLGVETTAQARVELQKASIGKAKIRNAAQRLLLGLIETPGQGSEGIPAEANESANGDSRPDAWLYGDDFVVLIESKVGGASLKPQQMQSHFQKLQVGTKHQPRCMVRTWAEVHQFFCGCIADVGDKDRWLIEQFTQYLEWKGMSGFTGFEEWMFEFFVRDEQDAEEKKLIRRTMERFGEKVLHRGLQALNPSFYQEPWVGKLSAQGDHFWAAFGPLGGPKVFGKVAHQTVSLYDYGLDVFVNVEMQPAIKMLKKKIHSDKGGFVKVVSRLPGPFSAWVFQKKMRPDRPMKSDEYLIATLEGGRRKPHDPGCYGLKDPASSAFEYLARLLEEIPLPYLSVRCRIDRKEVVKLSTGGGTAVVDRVLAIMKGFHPLVEFING